MMSNVEKMIKLLPSNYSLEEKQEIAISLLNLAEVYLLWEEL